jgi:hypothetical protein
MRILYNTLMDYWKQKRQAGRKEEEKRDEKRRDGSKHCSTVM